MPRNLSLTRDEAEDLVDLIDESGTENKSMLELGEEIRKLFEMCTRADQLKLDQDVEDNKARSHLPDPYGN